MGRVGMKMFASTLWTMTFMVGVVLALPQQTLAQATAPDAQNKISPYVLERLQVEDTVKVNIYLEDPITKEHLSKEELEGIVRQIGSEKVERTHPEVIIATLSQKEIESLAQKDEVRHIVPNIRIVPALEESVVITGAAQTWDIQIAGTNLTGAGRTICVIDTGVDFTHPDLAAKNKLVEFGPFTNVDCTVDGQDCFPSETATDIAGPFTGHGTHVAGIAAAEGGINGIAKGADLIAVKIFDENGNSDNAYLKMAVDWCANNANRTTVEVITMSIESVDSQGLPWLWVLPDVPCDGVDFPLADSLVFAVENGIPVLAASGNGESPELITFPACLSGAIPVAATKKNDAVWAGSNYGPLVKLFAPGAIITSTCPGNTYCISTGTSMSTPMVAGAMAIFKQFLELDTTRPDMNPFEIEERLYVTGDPVSGLVGDPNGYARINIYKAVTLCFDNNDCNDGNACNGVETCNIGVGCEAGIAPTCDDELFCNGAETCDSKLGCQAGTPPEVNDGVSCTVDSCDEEEDIIVHTPQDSVCSNDLFCDGAEWCDPISDCQAGEIIMCQVGEECDEEQDMCVLSCPADLDGDGQVRVPDLIILLAAWGANPGHPADFDDDGQVRVPDLIILLAAWGACA